MIIRKTVYEYPTSLATEFRPSMFGYPLGPPSGCYNIKAFFYPRVKPDFTPRGNVHQDDHKERCKLTIMPERNCNAAVIPIETGKMIIFIRGS
jgi:hypothetical protein